MFRVPGPVVTADSLIRLWKVNIRLLCVAPELITVTARHEEYQRMLWTCTGARSGSCGGGAVQHADATSPAAA